MLYFKKKREANDTNETFELVVEKKITKQKERLITHSSTQNRTQKTVSDFTILRVFLCQS